MNPPIPRMPVAGDQIGQFRILERIGAGGMGVVYLAEQVGLGRQVALKVISPGLAEDDEFRNRFIREAHAQGNLDSAHVVHVYAHGEVQGYLFMASQLVPDGDLAKALRSGGPLSVYSAVDVVSQMADALAAAHADGMVHRDIKPANVLLRRRSDGLHAYLTDFGVARVEGSLQTRVGVVVGTPTYQAPEMHVGELATPATDIYALGCLFWAALHAAAPYRGNEFEIASQHLNAPVPQVVEDSPAARLVNRILAATMAKQASARYPSAQIMRDDLRRLLPSMPRLPLSAVRPAPPRARLTDPSGGGATPSGPHPVPSQSVPSQPVPSQPVPSQPVPNQPVPSQPVPSQPVPSQPVPSQSVPSGPPPIHSGPHPMPSQPVPSGPHPIHSGPHPVPSHPVPDQPLPFGSAPRGGGNLKLFLLGLVGGLVLMVLIVGAWFVAR